MPITIKANTNKVNISVSFCFQSILCTAHKQAYLNSPTNKTLFSIPIQRPKTTKAISLDMAVYLFTDYSVSAMVSRPLGVVL